MRSGSLLISNELVMLNSLNISASSSSDGSGISLLPNKFLSGLSECNGATILCSSLLIVLPVQPAIFGADGKKAVAVPAHEAMHAARSVCCLIATIFLGLKCDCYVKEYAMRSQKPIADWGRLPTACS